jgi:hypothetical protein
MSLRKEGLAVMGLICALAALAGCGGKGSAVAELGPCIADDEPVFASVPPQTAPVFARDIAPLFDQYCAHCHDSATAEGGVVMDELSDGRPSALQRSLLLRIANNLRAGYMPPEGEPRPHAAELETINAWLDTMLSEDRAHNRRVSIRRLNRAEYNNTIRDLIGLDLRPAGDFPSDDVGYGFDNIGDVLSTPPILLEMYLTAAEKVIARAFASGAIRERLLNPSPNTIPLAFRRYTPPVRSPREDKSLRVVPAAPDPDLARQQHIYNILIAFCDRAFRRPASHDEVNRLLGIVVSAEKEGESADSALQLAFRAVLVSPQFLFLQDTFDREPGPSGSAVPINNFALASRLSYFLWSSMPDEPLTKLAVQGTLARRENLRAQVQRMLCDPRARALAENFGSQWLGTRRLAALAPDPTLFPDFDESLKAAMRTETELFFDSIRIQDKSVLTFLDADYTFVNERLARHYGLAGVVGGTFRRVSLTDTRRGGVLTHASVLAVTSNPNRTSPVKRGKWIMENILGTPPSPPPSGVEALKMEGSTRSSTLRQRMEQHRSNPACAACHRRMDPLGFGLENFDALGCWRDSEAGLPIDSSGQLPIGQTFRGASELKSALLTRRDEFALCLAEKMLIYALGRGLDRGDRRAVVQIVTRLRRKEYRFSALILAVVESDLFLNPRGNEGDR